jgi:hypothetical protein
MMTIRAHFDGKVFVPDETVDVPVGTPLRVTYERVAPSVEPRPRTGAGIVDQWPLVCGLSSEVVREIVDDPINELCNLDLAAAFADAGEAGKRATG